MIDNLKDAIEKYKDFAECETESASVLRNMGNEKDAKYFEETAENDKKIVAWLTELQERREADRWIPVTERTPDEDVDVIVSDMETYETYSAYYVGDGYWACDNGTYKHRITHWKPFPKKCDESGETIGEKFLSGWRNKSEATNE